jgi:tetratricopeptide (TPR) repeat protein
VKASLCAGLILLWGAYCTGCGPSAESVKVPAPPPSSKEELYRQGHALYAREDVDQAVALLEKALALDSLYEGPLLDLASLYYDIGMRGKGGSPELRGEHLRRAAGYFARLERSGNREPVVYERLCEISVELSDTVAFVLHAERYASHYPEDRQFHNLGVAYYEAGRYQDVIRSMKEAIKKFPESSYSSSFYRQLGYAYMKVDRHQTAERTLYAGLKAIEGGSARVNGTAETVRRVKDDTIAILLALRKLHRIYDAEDKLRDVERRLHDAGYRE